MDESSILRPGASGGGQSLARVGFGTQELEQRRETQATAVAERARAQIQAQYVMALQRPRDLATVRVRMLQHCDRRGFAEKAEYAKPIGAQKVTGPSIRFVEAALQEYGNVYPTTSVAYDDEEKRILTISVCDLERNVTYAADVTVDKWVERRSPRKGDEVLSSRKNSYGDDVYRIRADGDEFVVKQNAAVSKTLRTLGLRILPVDLVEEWIARCRVTVAQEFERDPHAEQKRIADAFVRIGVMPSDLATYLGHPLEGCSPSEILELRGIYTAIEAGEATWRDVVAMREPAEPSGEETTKPTTNPAISKLQAAIDRQREKAKRRDVPSSRDAEP